MDTKYITLSSFRFNILEALIQFSEHVNQEHIEDRPVRTAEDWWKEFKLYMEDI